MRRNPKRNVHKKRISVNDNNKPRACNMFGANNAQHQSQPVNSDEAPILRIFTPDKEDPRLAPYSEIDGAYIETLLEWSGKAKKVEVKSLPGVFTGAAIPGHEDYRAELHMQDECLKVEVGHKEHGVFLIFGVAPETTPCGQGLWRNFRGKGQQPFGPWCVELLSPAMEDVFVECGENVDWLLDFQRSVAWMWILITRAAKDLEVTIDPKTGEARLEEKRKF